MASSFRIWDWKSMVILIIAGVVTVIGVAEFAKAQNRKGLVENYVATGNIDIHAWEKNMSWFSLSSSSAYDDSFEDFDNIDMDDCEQLQAAIRQYEKQGVFMLGEAIKMHLYVGYEEAERMYELSRWLLDGVERLEEQYANNCTGLAL